MEAHDTTELMEQKTHGDKNQTRSALTISILAMVLAIASLGGSNAMKEATQENILAANAYAFYQAKNIRQTSFKLAAADLELQLAREPNMSATAKAMFEKKIEDFKKLIHIVNISKTTFDNKNIEIDKHFLATCYIKPVCDEAFNTWTGITTNVAEGLNNLYKKVLVHKDLPLDTTAIAFYKLSIYYCNEIQLAFCLQGNYRLKPGYITLQMDKCFIN